MTNTSIRLIDLMSLFHPLWHTRQTEMEADPNILSRDCVAQVLGLLDGRAGAVCMDTKPSVRLKIDPDYKAGRPEKPAAFLHQLKLVLGALETEGVPVWRVTGYEADDVIASAVARLVRDDEAITRGIQIVSQDKDLMQLVDDECGVTVLTLAIANRGDVVYDEAGVRQKLGVIPRKVGDYLCLVGDKSDNIIGAKGIGPKRAAELLSEQTLQELMSQVRSVSLRVTPTQRSSLLELEGRLDQVRGLVALAYDLDVPVDQVWAERTRKVEPATNQRPTPADALGRAPGGETNGAAARSDKPPRAGHTGWRRKPAPAAAAPKKVNGRRGRAKPSPDEFSFVPVEQLEGHPPLIIGLSGMSDSGKTYSALMMAQAIARARGGHVAAIDTEGRMKKYRNPEIYAELHPFNVLQLTPPFDGDRAIAACKAAIASEAACIILDSASDEWEGEGGVLQSHDEHQQWLSGGDQNKLDRVNMLSWALAKKPHQRWHSFILGLSVPIILCHRARRKIKINGGQVIDAGVQPVCDERLVYDMMFHLLMNEDKRDGSYKVLKGGYKHERHVFPANGRVDADALKRLLSVLH